MIQFSRSGVAILTVPNRGQLDHALEYARTLDTELTTFHTAEILVTTADRILKVDDVKIGRSGRVGEKWRGFLVTDPWWNDLLTVEFPVIVKQGGWYFHIVEREPYDEWDGIGAWYSKGMLKKGYGSHVEI